MSLKEIRIQRNWSQDELALLSGLSVRTIQRIERNHKAGLESLKSLAAVFNIEVAELREELKVVNINEENEEVFANNIIRFYAISAALIFMLIFPLMSALQDPSNWGPFMVMCFSWMLIIGVLAWQTFGSSWRNIIISWHQKR
ncbi:MAG: hypothetical protein COB56_09095 [Robiginitomaculum sp.]|nr:MAG: hypothetical protein COB56_09095 [Robiginitomaculum sp.]